MSLEDLTAGGDQTVRNKLILSTIAYVLGFSLVFILLGGAVSMMGQQLDAYKEFIRLAGGAVVIVFGAHLAGIVRIPFFDYEKKIHVRNKPLHILGVFLVGMAFGAGWSPCIGPLLGTILAIAATEGSVSHGMTLLSIYSLGMALPFILMSFFINYMLAFIKRASQWIRFVTVAAGVLLIVMGLLLVFDKMNMITAL